VGDAANAIAAHAAVGAIAVDDVHVAGRVDVGRRLRDEQQPIGPHARAPVAGFAGDC
jgi:hypothetical protein